MLKRAVVVMVAGAILAGAACSPPAATFVRGDVVAVTGDTLTVSQSGANQEVRLAPTWSVSVLKPIEISAIQPGSFIGSAEMPQPNGTGKSLEVHVFPPGVKMGEGHYGWDSQPGSMMTNGTVDGVAVAPTGGRTLQVKYGDETRTIEVPPEVPVVQITDGERAAVKPGVPVFVVALKTPAGLVAQSVTVGENGARPAM